MEISGKLKSIKETNQVTDSFKNRKVWIETEEQYPQTIEVTFTQDKCDFLDQYKVDENVVISINLRGRAVKSKKDGKDYVFNEIQGWFIKRQEGSNSNQTESSEDDDPFGGVFNQN